MTASSQEPLVEPKRRPFDSLRSKILVGFGLLFVATLSLVSFVGTFGIPFTDFTGSYGRERDEVFRNLGLTADLKKERLASWLADRKKDARFISDTSLVESAVRQLHDRVREGEPLGTGADLTELESYKTLNDYLQLVFGIWSAYHRIQVVDAKSGVILASTTPTDVGDRIQDRQGLVNSISAPQGISVEVSESLLRGEPDLIINSMIPKRFPTSDDDEIAVGVLRLFVSTDEILRPLLYMGEGLGRSGDIVIVNADQRILMPVKYPLPDGTIAKVLEYQIKAKPAYLAAKGHDGIILADDYRGVPVLAAYRNLMVTPDESWGLVVKRDESDVFYPLFQRLIYFFLSGLAIMVVALALIALMTRKISEPILGLSRTAREVEAGNYSARANVESSDEMGALAKAFNSMIERVENWHEEMNEKVKARTLELNELNESLMSEIAERKLVEQALRESDAKLKSIFRAAPTGIGVVADRIITEANQSLCDMTGYAREELLNQNALLLYPTKEEFDLVGREKYEQIANKGTGTVETRWRRKDGEVINVLLSSTPLDEADMALGVTFTALDITERKQAEKKLEKEKQFSDTTIDTLPGIFYLFDEIGRIMRWNKNFERVSGYSIQEISGMHPVDFFSGEERGIVGKAIAEAFAKGEAGVEADLVSKGGSKTPYYFTGRRLMLDGKQCLAGMGIDIAERKEAEEALRESEQRLNLALEGADLGLMDWNLKTGRAVWNERATGMLGYLPDDVEPNFRTWKSLIHPEDWPKFSEVLNGHLEGILPLFEVAYRIRCKSGEWKWIAARGKIMGHDTDGNPLRMAGTTLDITERKLAQQERESLRAQLLQAQKMEAVGTLAGGIAHDFNNLLQVTLGYSELLLQERKEDDPEYADLLKIFQAAKNGAELVQRMLTFSRKVEPKPIPLNLNRRILQVEKLLRRTIPKMIDIQMDLSDDLAEVHADPTQVEQVLMNLSVNARDAMPDGGTLTLETSNVTLDEEYCRIQAEAMPGEFVLLAVSDTGHGMDKATIEHIFEPFYTTKELGRGTGLGLAMVYGIVKQHGGHINCYSEVGHGTTFRVYFPASDSQVEPDVHKTGVMPAFGTETILLVDDEEFVRDLGARILSKAGYQVLTATNGREALDLFEKERTQISLVILDLIMPKMGGKDCLKELLKIDPKVTILVASGYSADASAKECVGLGAKGFVGKPFRFKELLQTVRKVLDEVNIHVHSTWL